MKSAELDKQNETNFEELTMVVNIENKENFVVDKVFIEL